MTARMQQIAANPLARIGVVIGAVVVAVPVGLIVILAGSGSEQEPAFTGQSGGGGEPSARLLEVYDSLPFPSGLTIDQDPVSTGVELLAFHWAEDEPSELIAFYNRELVALGWEPAELPSPVVSGQREGATHPASSDVSFVKDDLRIIIGVAANTKAPAYGASRLGITIEPR